MGSERRAINYVGHMRIYASNSGPGVISRATCTGPISNSRRGAARVSAIAIVGVGRCRLLMGPGSDLPDEECGLGPVA